MQESSTKNCLNIDDFIVNKISSEFIEKFSSLDGSKFYKMQTILGIKESIKNELQKEYSFMFNENDYETIFNKYENKFLTYLQKSKKKEKEIFKNTVISQYKKHLKQFKNATSFKSAITFKNTGLNSQKSLKTLFKIEFVKLTKHFKNLSNKNNFSKKYFGNFLNLPFSLLSTFMLFLLWKCSSTIITPAKKETKNIKICKKYLQKQNILQINKISILAKLYYNIVVNSISNCILSTNNFIGGILHKISDLLALNSTNQNYDFQPIYISKQYIPKDIEYSIFMKNTNDIMKKITKKIDYNFYNNLFQLKQMNMN